MPSYESLRPRLTNLGKNAYFPPSGANDILATEALRRAGPNLVYAIEYGSHVSGDAGPTSKRDFVIIVDDIKKFHRDNLGLAPGDYATPHIARWHTYLNQFGFNFYQTGYRENDHVARAKYAVISKDDFVKGCNGCLKENGKESAAFGFYIAGRMQKAALRPLYKGSDEQAVEIEQAINNARVDGVWLAIGMMPETFDLTDLARMYVSLSYKADLRVEKADKAEILFQRSKQDYLQMLAPIVANFIDQDLLRPMGYNEFQQWNDLSRQEVEKRLRDMKLITALTNYIKNPLTTGIGRGIEYALEKIVRSLQHNRKKHNR